MVDDRSLVAMWSHGCWPCMPAELLPNSSDVATKCRNKRMQYRVIMHRSCACEPRASRLEDFEKQKVTFYGGMFVDHVFVTPTWLTMDDSKKRQTICYGRIFACHGRVRFKRLRLEVCFKKKDYMLWGEYLQVMCL
jgi:hypothetical protein